MAEELGGRWVTSRGRHIFIRDGETPEQALARSTQRRQDAPPAEFNKLLHAAKASLDERVRWRVDSTHSDEDYEEDKRIVLGKGSTVAVTPDGDIISVCRNAADTAVRGKDLIEAAIQQGGTKLDCYSGLFGFYRKCGFEPVSWCAFDPNYAPDDWNSGRDKPEDIIFFAYTGNKATGVEKALDWQYKVAPADDYDSAMRARDEYVKKMRAKK